MKDWHEKCKWYKSSECMTDKKSACLAHLHEEECGECWPKDEEDALKHCPDYNIQLKKQTGKLLYILIK